MGERLTDQKRLFCKEYVVDLNATQAALRAGYSAGGPESRANASAQTQGSKLLSSPLIQAEIQRYHRASLNKVGLRAEDVIAELRAIAFSDVRLLVDEHNQPLPLRSLPDEVASAVASVSVDSDGRGGTRTRIRTWDKTTALRMLIDRLLPAVQAHVIMTPDDLARLSDADLDRVEAANQTLMDVSASLSTTRR
jgi:phage terminase small subunit